jgi:hypothetical protein
MKQHLPEPDHKQTATAVRGLPHPLFILQRLVTAGIDLNANLSCSMRRPPGSTGFFSVLWIYLGEADKVGAATAGALEWRQSCIIRHKPWVSRSSLLRPWTDLAGARSWRQNYAMEKLRISSG